ncbi:tyrosine-type recombinase/integrase [Caballeronia calidae]|nr:tyrosine-type recombinase/integrase [Caballeronia calidae]
MNSSMTPATNPAANPADWIDTGALPAQRLPDTVDAALAYLGEALGHPVYRRWTLAHLKRAAPSLAEAKRAHPAVFALLLDHAAAVEYWDHGRLHLAADDTAPAADRVLARVLHAHRRRFRCLPDTAADIGAGRHRRTDATSFEGARGPRGSSGPDTPGRSDETEETGLTNGTDETDPVERPEEADTVAVNTLALVALAGSNTSDPASLRTWLARAGRFMNASATNSLGAADDAQALALFLRDRAHRSPHTLRAYRTDLRRLIDWCQSHRRGPLSDLTRDDLLAFRRSLDRTADARGPAPIAPAHARSPSATHAATHRATLPATRPAGSDASRQRTLAVLSSLYRYWQKTGYLVINPAVELSAGAPARMAWTPVRILPTRLLELCDAVMAGDRPPVISPLVWARRRAVWSLYRFAGVRLAELEWSAERGLPRLSVDPAVAPAVDTTVKGAASTRVSPANGASARSDNVARAWTLQVHGKGNKVRAIPLPSRCAPVLRAYRLARGLPAEPAPFESVPLIHSEKRDALGHSGLYDEVKAVLLAAEQLVPPDDTATRALLHAASTHWLRHGYARTLVVDHAVPLPVAQTLLGHASVQTTAAYARTDLTQLRAFVEGSFAETSRN